MKDINLSKDQWYCRFETIQECSLILLVLEYLIPKRFKIDIKPKHKGYIYNGVLYVDISDRLLHFPEISLNYILNSKR